MVDISMDLILVLFSLASGSRTHAVSSFNIGVSCHFYSLTVINTFLSTSSTPAPLISFFALSDDDIKDCEDSDHDDVSDKTDKI